MVRLHTSLLAVSLVTGSVLASFSEYQRRSERDVISHLRFGYALGDHSVRSREFEDNDDFFGRDSLDNLEAREPNFPVGAVFAAKRFSKHVNYHNLNRAADAADKINTAIQTTRSFQNRGLEDDDTLVGRNIPIGTLVKARRRLRSGHRVNSHKLDRVAKAANGFNDGIQVANDLQNRDLEEELVGRDLDDFFGREYDYPLEERDDLD